MSQRLLFALLAGLLLVVGTAPAMAQPDRPNPLDFNLNDLGGLGGSPFGDLGLKPRGSDEKATVSSRFVPAAARPGQIVTLEVTIKVPEGSHTFSQDTEAGGPTEIVVEQPMELETVDEGFTPDRPPHVEPPTQFFGATRQYEGKVTWSRRFRVKPSLAGDLTQPRTITAGGKIDFQVCDTRCVPYDETLSSTLTIEPGPVAAAVGDESDVMAFGAESDDETAFGAETGFGSEADGEASFGTEASDDATGEQSFGSDEAAAASTSSVDEQFAAAQALSTTKRTLGVVEVAQLIGLSLLGGLILNFMPCVLPVLSIKATSLASFAAEHTDKNAPLADQLTIRKSAQRESTLMGVGYTIGVLAVMAALATAMVVLQIGWGQQFQSPTFVAVVAIVVFVLSLSLLGVYELPVPGFVGRADAATDKEGFGGALFSGIFATLLATPCIGPFLGSVMGQLLRLPSVYVFVVMLSIGLGLASPFLLIGFFPRLVSWLPKPGMWMVRFKQISGFVLLGTVIWLLRPLAPHLLLPVLTVMLGLAAALWIYGEFAGGHWPLARRLGMQALAVLVAVGVGFVAYRMTPKNADGTLALRRGTSEKVEVAEVSPAELPWEAFDGDAVKSMLASGETVLLDFTADWCANCKVNEAVALNTRETREFVDRHGIRTVMADWTEDTPNPADDEIKQWLNAFGYNAIPLTIIFPGGSIEDRIEFDALFTQSALLDALEDAVEFADNKTNAERIDEEIVDLDWKDFDTNGVEEFLAEEKTVLLFFDADWDPTSKVIEATSLKKPAVKAFIEEHEIEIVRGDLTEDRPGSRVDRFIRSMGYNTTPLTVVFPRGQFDDRIVLDAMFTEAEVLNALERAVKRDATPPQMSSRDATSR